jgi:hypothetical protein
MLWPIYLIDTKRDLTNRWYLKLSDRMLHVSSTLVHPNRWCAGERACSNREYLRQLTTHMCSYQRIRHVWIVLMPVRATFSVVSVSDSGLGMRLRYDHSHDLLVIDIYMVSRRKQLSRS